MIFISMPYKVKGKCIYKKDTNEKVGCTKGSVKKYLAALHANVNEDLDWIRTADTYRGDYVIKRPSGKHTYFTVTDEYSHGPNSQPAVKYYIGDKLPVLALSMAQGTMLISTLQEKINNGQWERLGTFTEPRTSTYDSMLGESDFDWAKNPDTMRLLSVEELQDGKLYMFNTNQDVVNTVGNVPKWVYDYQGQVIKVVKNNLKRNVDSDGTITFIPYGSLSRINYKPNSDSVTLSHKAQMFVYGLFSEVHDEPLNENFEWIENVPANMTPGEQYYVKQPSGVWTAVEYCGKGETEHPDTGEKIMGHRFTDIDSRTGKCNEWWSNESLKYKIDNNLIREYDSEWTILDDIEFGTLNDIEGRNFVIYFENGIDIGDTVELQKRLFDMGYHFPNRGGKFKPVTNEDTNGKKIIMFECYNWDTSNNRYKRMPSDYRDRGIMLMVTDKQEDSSFFRSDKERQLQNRFSTVIDHNAVVVNGYDYLNNNINESEFDWVDTVPNDPIKWNKPKITLDDVEMDEDGWPVEETHGDGEGEVWIDFERYNQTERMEILSNIEKHLGKSLIYNEGGAREDKVTKMRMCTSKNIKGILLHCGHEENHYFSQENHVCCMRENYQEFKEYEEIHSYREFRERPIVDGGIFLYNTINMNEGFYYKGVNPTVDLIVIRGDKVLLIKRSDDAEAEPGKWALPGGFHDTNAKKGEEWKDDKESSLEAAKREVKEETGLDVDRIEGLNFTLVGVFEGGGRDPRDREDSWTRSTVYMVHIPESEGDEVRGMDDAQRAEWVPLSLVLQRKLAFDHHKIIEKAIKMNESDAFNNLKDILTEDFDWTQDVGITKEAIRNLMSNCEDIPVTNFNLEANSPYTRRGKMNIMYYSMCPYWWDRFKDLPVDEHGRGKGEWFVDNDRGKTKVAVIMPDRNGVTDVRSEDNEDMSAITYDLKWIEPYFNGKSSELWLFLDDNGDPRYDLLPDDLVDRVRKGFEGVEKSKTIEENFDWTDDIPSETDIDLWEKVSGDIDNEVSGPWSGNIRDRFTELAEILDNYNIDIEDMGDFFMYPPDGPKDKNGNYITNHQLHELHQDLIDLGISLTPEQERDLNLESVNEDFDWVEDVGTVRIGDVFHTRTQYTPTNRGEDTFEIFDVSPDGKWVRWTHHDTRGIWSSGQRTEPYLPIENINKETLLKGWDKAGYNPANSTPIEQVIKNINNGFWKRSNILGYMDEHPEAYDKIIKLGSKMNENFDWVDDAPDYDAYRFFDVYVCGDNQYDEETGEDECLDGGSYFLRIPKEEVDEIWDLDIDDMGGPGDEGLGVIQWAERNDKIDPSEYAMVEYVREIDRVEFCQAVRFSNQDICGGLGFNDLVNESKVLTEGRYDKVTNELSKTAMINIKKGKKRFEDKIRLFTRTFVDIVFYVKYSDEYNNPRVYAATHLDPKAIRSYFKNKRIIFDVEVPTENGVIVKEHLPELLSELKNIVRHEIEHVTQSRFKDRQRKGFFTSRSYPENLTYTEYLTEPYETEAYVRGLYKKAKTLRKPFNDVLNDYFERLRIEGELTPEEVDIVKTHWLSYANKHLPMTVNRKYGYELTESNEFDWAREDLPPFYTLEWKEHPLALTANKVWDELGLANTDFDMPTFNTFKELKQARKEYPNGKWISVISGPNWIPSAFEDNPTDPEDINSDKLGDRFEVWSSDMEDPQIMTTNELNQYMVDFESR